MIDVISSDSDLLSFDLYYNMIYNMLLEGKWRYVINEHENLLEALQTKLGVIQAFGIDNDSEYCNKFNMILAWYNNESS